MGTVNPAPGVPPSTGQGAQGVPDFDHRPVVDGLENQLQEWLNRPVQDILNQFHMGQLPSVAPHDLIPSLAGAPEHGELGGGSGMGGMGGGNGVIGGLLKPATDLLGTLGNGVFQGLNPTQMFSGVSQAFEQAASGLQQALGQMMGGMGQGWSGASAGAAAAKTGQTLANGAAVGAQGVGLGGHYTAAGTDVAQGHSRLLETLVQGQNELEALAGGLPWTAANMVESASRTTARATAIVTELESTLTAEAGATSATGAPVALAQGPQAAMGMLGPMMSIGMSMMGPAMQLGMMPMEMGIQAASTGLQAGTSLISQVGQGAGTGVPAAAAGGGVHLANAASKLGGGGGGGLGSATTPARALPSSPMLQRETAAATVSPTSLARTAGGSGAGSGAGMMGGPGMAGAGAGAKGRDGNHTTAAFLHTTDQGGEIVGDLGTASPPVIGETVSDENPDVQLRI